MKKVCVNVSVNKGEDVVKDKDVLPAAWRCAVLTVLSYSLIQCRPWWEDLMLIGRLA
jgi:hypothetical protein